MKLVKIIIICVILLLVIALVNGFLKKKFNILQQNLKKYGGQDYEIPPFQTSEEMIGVESELEIQLNYSEDPLEEELLQVRQLSIDNRQINNNVAVTSRNQTLEGFASGDPYSCDCFNPDYNGGSPSSNVTPSGGPTPNSNVTPSGGPTPNSNITPSGGPTPNSNVTPSGGSTSGNSQKWRWCVWSTPGWQASLTGKPCGGRGGKDGGSDPSAGQSDFSGASGLTGSGSSTHYGVLEKSGAPQSLLPQVGPNFKYPCPGSDKETAFPKGQWAWILHGGIGANRCTTDSGNISAEAGARYDWWLKTFFGGQSWNSASGSLKLSGEYLKNLLSKVDTSLLDQKAGSDWKTKGITAYGSAGHGMWGGNCKNFDLSLFWLKDKFIINMQTGPRTWSGEITQPYGEGGGYGPAIVPHGITLTGLDEFGNQIDSSLDIFEGTGDSLKLKSGVTLSSS